MVFADLSFFWRDIEDFSGVYLLSLEMFSSEVGLLSGGDTRHTLQEG